MEQFYRDPQAVVGDDPALLAYWNTMPGRVQTRLLESGLTVSTLGELQSLCDQLEHEE